MGRVGGRGKRHGPVNSQRKGPGAPALFRDNNAASVAGAGRAGVGVRGREEIGKRSDGRQGHVEPAGLLKDFYLELKDVRSHGRVLAVWLMFRKEAVVVRRGGESHQSGSSGGGRTGSDSGTGFKTEQQNFPVGRMRVVCESDENRGYSAVRDRLRVEWVFLGRQDQF